ncbi:MAG: DUF4443 domain-containing protein [Desulfurococcaceae archaeon TW002]
MKKTKVLLKITEERGGVKPAFSPYHVFKVLEFLHARGVSSRHELMRLLGLGEASVKTLLNRLREIGFVSISRPHGTKLTEAGKELVSSLVSIIKLIPYLRLESVCVNCTISGLVLSGGYAILHKVGGVVVLRDLIVKEGADGALILTYSKGIFYLPVVGGLEKLEDEELHQQLKDFHISEGDLIVLGMCYSSDGERCLVAAVNAIIKVLSFDGNEE